MQDVRNKQGSRGADKWTDGNGVRKQDETKRKDTKRDEKGKYAQVEAENASRNRGSKTKRDETRQNTNKAGENGLIEPTKQTDERTNERTNERKDKSQNDFERAEPRNTDHSSQYITSLSSSLFERQSNRPLQLTAHSPPLLLPVPVHSSPAAAVAAVVDYAQSPNAPQ